MDYRGQSHLPHWEFSFFLLFPFPNPLLLFPQSCAPTAVLPVLSSPFLHYHPLVLTTPGCSKKSQHKGKKKNNFTFSLEAISQSMLCLLHRLRGLNNNLIFSPGRVSAASLSPLGMAQLLKAPQIPGEDYSR